MSPTTMAVVIFTLNIMGFLATDRVCLQVRAASWLNQEAL